MNTTNVLQGRNRCTRPNLRSSAARSHSVRESGAIVREADDPLCDDDLIEVDNEDFVMFDDNQDVSKETEEDKGPDVSVSDLCLKLEEIRLTFRRVSSREKLFLPTQSVCRSDPLC